MENDTARAAGQQVVMNEVAIAADTADAADERPEPAPLRRASQTFKVAGGDNGTRQLRNAAHPDRALVQVGAAPLLGPGQLAIGRRARDAEHQPPGTPQRDLRGKEDRKSVV